MARRSSLPGADELFRTTSSPASATSGRAPDAPARSGTQSEASARLVPAEPDRQTERARQPVPERELAAVPALTDHREGSPVRNARDTGTNPRGGSGVRRVSRAKSTDAEHQPSGRERHDEKITVYVSPQELLELERARWVLRAEHGLASDRGRIVREAVAVVLADLEAKGAQSILVTRLQELENR